MINRIIYLIISLNVNIRHMFFEDLNSMSENNQGGVIYRKSRMAITSNGHHIKLGEKEAF